MLSSLTSLLLHWSIDELGNEVKFSSENINYGLFSTVARNAHCDGDFLRHVLGDDSKSDYQSSCGMACRDIFQYSHASKLDVTYFQEKVSHTQFISFTSNSTLPLGATEASTKTIIGFRGTVAFDIINQRRNFVFKFAPSTLCPGCHIHHGFWRNYLSLRPSVSIELDDLAKSSKTVAFTGMSMGAPLATLAAITASNQNFEVTACVTFGMPRVANSALAMEVITMISAKYRTVGFAYGRDPVPHVPPRFFGFRSTQSALYHTFQQFVLTSEGFDSSVWNTRIDDHDVGDYIYFDKVYLNAKTTFDGDKEFAGSASTFDLNDHTKYFDLSGVYGCGFDSADRFLHVSNAAELFFV